MPRSQDAPKLRLVHGRMASGRAERGGRLDDFSDARLVELVGSGDRDAFETLYRRHSGFAFGLAVRIQGGSTDVEDIVHDAFVRAHDRLSDLKDIAAFRPWLGSIVVRLVRSRLRRLRLLSVLGLSSPDPVDLDAITSPDADPESRVLLSQVYALLQTLPASERIAWTLRFIERQRLETIAELMSCSLATAKRRIQRAQRFIFGHFVAPFSKDDHA